MRLKIFWSLYHLPSRSQIDGLSQAQVSGLVNTFSEKSYANWRIWKQGTSEWFELNHYPEVFSITNSEKVEVERAQRYNRRLKVYVDIEGHIHSSSTVDISETGILVDPPFPVKPVGPFEMQVMNPETGTTVHVICKLVDSANEPNRFEIVKVPKKVEFEYLLKEEEESRIARKIKFEKNEAIESSGVSKTELDLNLASENCEEELTSSGVGLKLDGQPVQLVDEDN